MTGIDALLQLMKDLRDPQSGCPWDIRQTSLSIAPHTLDETHELLDAIERGDIDNIKEELGDLLFNIVFHACIAEEQGQFDFNDVANGIVDKMVRRHPHVFGAERDKKLSEEQLSAQWQALKQQEKSASSKIGVTPAVSANSPIFSSRQIQKDAAEFGFDWPDISFVIDKLDEEVAELKRAISEGDKSAISDELGDVLFVCVNIARHARVNAEMALRQCNQKFTRRFEYVQQQMLSVGISMNQRQLEQMEQFWQESKGVVG